jgi:hypothetical protein
VSDSIGAAIALQRLVVFGKVAYVQIQCSIVVVVEEHCAGKQARLIEAGLFGHVGEGAVVVVVVKDQAAVGGYEKIGPTVTVIVRGGHTNTEVPSRNAGFFGYVGKCAIVIVVIQGVAQRDGG